jgi:hypothetical protein
MTVDLVLRSERLKFSSAKHYLGPLCKRAHDGGGGKSWRHIGHGNCVECCREGARLWKVANPQQAATNTKRRDRKRVAEGKKKGVWHLYPFASFAGQARSRGRKLNIPVGITPDDLRRLWIKQEGKCFWTGARLDFEVGGQRHPLRPSLDRINPKLGYVPSNIVWATNFANRARGDLPFEDFVEIMLSFGFSNTLAAQEAKLASAYTKFSVR